MGVTQYVTLTTREYALLARLEGQVRTLLNTEIESTYERTGPCRDSMNATLMALNKLRQGKR
jgi:hypothetical protein